MQIKRTKGWEIPERLATDESTYLNRRQLVKGMAAGGLLAGLGLPSAGFAGPKDRPALDLYPAKNNPAFTLDRPLTLEEEALNYVNFYEFGSHKKVANATQSMNINPWQLKIDGLVEKELTMDIDQLIRQMPLEERLYRHRCVEAWSMAVPWTGFPLKALLDLAKPLSGAKYIRMETLADKATMPGLQSFWYPWPYIEGLTIEEAATDLTFMATGLYGKPLANQNGAPIRLVTPWKYGFKSIKSIVRISFTDERPISFWESIQASEYGFWANVNPEVPHARWSQANERVLGTGEHLPTLMYNGYGEHVAHLYKGMDKSKLFM